MNLMTTPLCGHCEEPLLPGEDIRKGLHIECMTRLVLGSVAHQQRRCGCFGGTEQEDPHLTKREAARAAYQYGKLLHDLRAQVEAN